MITLTSPAFKNNQPIPQKYSYHSDNINPPLVISHIPPQTTSLALMISDPDAPSGAWVHWFIYNISPQTTQIDENSIPQGAIPAANSWSHLKYDGPAPPFGTHRYFFQIYALNITLPPYLNYQNFNSLISGHILDRGELIGLFSK